MKCVYHLKLTKKSIEGARIVLLPGDPGRVPLIASSVNKINAREIAQNREFRSWVTRLDRHPVLVTSTGIGGPSTSIAVEELATLGVRMFIRLGKIGRASCRER